MTSWADVVTTEPPAGAPEAAVDDELNHIPFDDDGQRTLPPDAVRHRDEQLLRLDAEASAAVGDRLHAGLPHNCLKIVEDEIAALGASTLSSAVVGSPCLVPLGACPVPVPSWHRAHMASQHVLLPP